MNAIVEDQFLEKLKLTRRALGQLIYSSIGRNGYSIQNEMLSKMGQLIVERLVLTTETQSPAAILLTPQHEEMHQAVLNGIQISSRYFLGLSFQPICIALTFFDVFVNI